LLIDESVGMGAVMKDLVSDGSRSTKSNAERLATAINALIKQLADGPEFEVALVGYRANESGEPDVGSRWAAALAGREFVTTRELAASPLRVETRTRKVPAADGFSPPREEPVEFPIWYAPALKGKAPQVAAMNFCRDLLARWQSTAPGGAAPVVVHISAGASADGNPQMAVVKLQDMTTAGGKPLLFQVHLAASADVVSAHYPSNQAYLTMGSSRDLFRRSSELPAALLAALKEGKINVNPGARAMLYNAKIGDVIRLFGLVKTHTRGWASQPAAPAAAPAAAEPAPVAASAPAAVSTPAAEPGNEAAAPAAESEPLAATAESEKAALVALVLDRSVEDPFAAGMNNCCVKLQDYGNDLLKQISKLKDLTVDAAIVSYGVDSAGQMEVRTTFDGPLAGQSIVRNSDLADGALRVDEFEEQMSNGIGGLISVTRKKPIYFELEPTSAASPVEAFTAVAELIGTWCSAHPTAATAPLVLHLTRGRQDSQQLEQAASQLQSIACAAGPVRLCHLVATDFPHKSLSYMDSDHEIEAPGLRKLWELSSPLLGREQLAASKPAVKEASRAIVINGKFDVFLDGIKFALAGQPA
jgi:hypothetical protein